MPKSAWLAFGTVLAVGGIALMLFNHLWAGVAMIVVSCAFDLLFVKALHDEHKQRTGRSR